MRPIPPNFTHGLFSALIAQSKTPSVSPQTLLSGLLPVASPQWIYVRKRFRSFLDNILLTQDQLDDGKTKISNVLKCLNKHYYNIDSETANHMLGGSWGKQTRVRPPRDIDLIFVMPYEVYQRYSQRTGNIQSQLLQEVKSVLDGTFSTTSMRSDGQVVMVKFGSFMVEVVPAFLLKSGQYWICDTNNGGRYKTVDPVFEKKCFNEADKKWNRNARDLVRMTKTWQAYCNVPISSFILEQLAMGFLEQWPYSSRDEFWYDWIVRDFFAYMICRANGSITMQGTGEIIYIGDQWESRAISAQKASEIACEHEKLNLDQNATTEWQKIFGYEIGRAS